MIDTNLVLNHRRKLPMIPKKYNSLQKASKLWRMHVKKMAME